MLCCELPMISGFSLIEVMVALSLIMLGALLATQSVFHADTEFTHSRAALKNRLHDDSLAAHIDASFSSDNLSISDNMGHLDSSAISELIDQTSLTIAPVMGTRSRYQDNLPRCVLAHDASLSPAHISFDSDCLVTDDNQTIAHLIDELFTNGVPLTFGLMHGSGLCTSSSAPSHTGMDEVAYLDIRSSDCLLDADNITAEAGIEIIFPRFMVFDPEYPGLIFHALIENAAARLDGASLSMPASVSLRSGRRSAIDDVRLSSLSADTSMTLHLSTIQDDARISIDDTAGTTVTDNNSSALIITGRTDQIIRALEGLHYLSPDSYFGTDQLHGEIRIGPQLLSDHTDITVEPNCGEQTEGTAVRFDLGYLDNTSFVLSDYLTAVSLVTEHVPQRYYGYCRDTHTNSNPRHRYDLDNGSRNLIETAFNCEDISDPDSTLNRNFEQASTAIEFDEEDKLTVFVYEESDRYDEDRFSLFFLFGDAGNDCETDPDEGGDTLGRCEVDVSLSNLESGRDLEDITDVFTFADDPGEYAGDDGTAVISDTGVISMTPVWRGAHDGLVVPLRLPQADNYSETNLPALSSYEQDPDGDNNSDPSLTLNSTDTLHDWLVRGLSEDGLSVDMRSFSFDLGSSDERSTIRLVISEARQCPSS